MEKQLTSTAFQLSEINSNVSSPLATQTSSKVSPKIWKVIFNLKEEKVNKFSRKVMEDFQVLLKELENLNHEKKIDALILCTGKKGNFIAGADIELIQSAHTSEEAETLSRTGQKLLDQWEDLPFPTVVAIDGAALGGGCELSLASSAIVMSSDPSAKIGLPEVMLGIIPGMGGCVRLPRKIGIVGALDLILMSKILSGEKAYKLGLIEAYLPKENFENSAVQWVYKNFSDLKSNKRIARLPKLGGMGGLVGKTLESSLLQSYLFKKAKEGVVSKTKGHYPAPLEVLSVLKDTGAKFGPKLRGSAREKALIREAKGFGKVAITGISKNLIQLFFLTELVKKMNGLPLDSSEKKVEEIAIQNAAVLGAGVMGGGIAQLFADKSIPIRMKDLNVKALSLGVQQANDIFKKQVKRKKITDRQMFQKLNRIAPALDYHGFKKVDLVIEAIVENLEIKKKILQEIENEVSSSCVLASNTSSLSVSEMQKVLKNPERFVGMHFFNPVSKMPLVEVIRGQKSSDVAVATIFQLSKKLGKTPIVVKDSPGFLVNRLLMPYLNEAIYLASEGVPFNDLDQALLKFGMPMGPMELIDEVGVDVGDKVSHILFEAFGDRMKPSEMNSKVIQAGRLGKKTNKGLYEYSGPKKTKVLNPEIYSLIGIKPRSGAISYEEIIDRCILPMINEASRCLEENVVSSPSEVDLGMIMGTGFPPFRGGLLRYADSVGAAEIVERLKKYEARFGARYAPAPALVAQAQKGQKFYK